MPTTTLLDVSVAPGEPTGGKASEHPGKIDGSASRRQKENGGAEFLFVGQRTQCFPRQLQTANSPSIAHGRSYRNGRNSSCGSRPWLRCRVPLCPGLRPYAKKLVIGSLAAHPQRQRPRLLRANTGRIWWPRRAPSEMLRNRRRRSLPNLKQSRSTNPSDVRNVSGQGHPLSNLTSAS